MMPKAFRMEIIIRTAGGVPPAAWQGPIDKNIQKPKAKSQKVQSQKTRFAQAPSTALLGVH
jgi:hypothetical protein